MRRFYLAYKDRLKMRRLIAEIHWGQNLVIMNKVKNEAENLYYITATKEQAWTRDTLRAKINSNAYKHHRLSDKKNNFDITLPKQLAEQADQLMKDVYLFDRLGITETEVLINQLTLQDIT